MRTRFGNRELSLRCLYGILGFIRKWYIKESFPCTYFKSRSTVNPTHWFIRIKFGAWLNSAGSDYLNLHQKRTWAGLDFVLWTFSLFLSYFLRSCYFLNSVKLLYIQYVFKTFEEPILETNYALTALQANKTIIMICSKHNWSKTKIIILKICNRRSVANKRRINLVHIYTKELVCI